MNRKEYQKKIFEQFCPGCEHFEHNPGVCQKLHLNVRDYPINFLNQCNLKFYRPGVNKIVPESNHSE